MLDRNRRIKQHPERFQLCTDQFNVVITCEERVYDQVLECMLDNVNNLITTRQTNCDNCV